MTSGQTYLDLGCCFGQDIRRLVYDGAPGGNCYGSDLRLEFMELGYDLFLDRGRLGATFIAADVFDADSGLKRLDGGVDIVHAASFFHLFGYSQQKAIAKRVVRLLRPVEGSLLVGRQVGNVTGGEFPHRTNPAQVMFRHDAETWGRMWEEVGEETGTRWEAKAELLEWPGFVAQGEEGEGQERQTPLWQHEGARRLQFTVRRMA